MVPRCVTSHASPRANGGTRSLRQSALSRRSICTGRGRLDLPRQHPRVDVARATSRRLLRRQTDRAWVKARVQGRNCPLGTLLERRLRFSALAGAPGKREHESDDRCSGQVPSRAAQRPHRGRRYSTRSVGLRGSSTASAPPVRTRCFDHGSGGEPLLAQFGRAYVSPRVLRENVVDGSEDGVDADDGIVASDLFELLS